MKKIILSILIVFMFSLVVNAEEYTCENLKADINLEEGIQLPKYIPFKNEVVNVFMDEEIVGSIKTEKGKVTSFECELMEDPTYAIHIKDSTVIDDIAASEAPLDEINAKMKSGDIEVRPIKTGKKIKWFFSKIVLKIGAMFT